MIDNIEEEFAEAELRSPGRLRHISKIANNKVVQIPTSEEPEPKNDLKPCATACLIGEVECPFRECKHWIEHQGDLNCDLIAIDRNGQMTLRQIAERIGVSFVRIKQIEFGALKKLEKRLNIIEQNDV